MNYIYYKMYAINLERVTEENTDYRRVLHTTKD